MGKDIFYSASSDLSSSRVEMVSADGSQSQTYCEKKGLRGGKKTINGWTDELDGFLIEWSDRYSKRAALHRRDKVYYKKKDMYIFIPTILLTAISSIIVLIQTNFCLSILSLVAGVLGVISIFISSLKEYFNYKGLSVQHGVYSKMYYEVATELKIVHAIEWKNRRNGLEYITKIKLKLDQITEKAPYLRGLNVLDTFV